jgi:hypothetical protein
MLATVTRSHAASTVEREHAAIETLITATSTEHLGREGTVRAGLFPGQRSSLLAMIGHLQLWENIGIEAIAAVRRGESPWICDPQYATTAAGARLNLADDAAKADWPQHRVIQSWRSTAQQLEQLIQSLTDAEWVAPVPYKTDDPEDWGGLLQSVLTAPREQAFEHLANHLPTELRASVAPWMQSR